MSSCPYHDKMMPQWCGDCGGFAGWFCNVCGESMPESSDLPGHCRCIGGSKHWMEGPSPSLDILVSAAMLMDGIEPGDILKRAGYLARIMLAPTLVTGGN